MERHAEAARDYIKDWLARFDPEDTTQRGNTCVDIGTRLGYHGNAARNGKDGVTR